MGDSLFCSVLFVQGVDCAADRSGRIFSFDVKHIQHGDRGAILIQNHQVRGVYPVRADYCFFFDFFLALYDLWLLQAF